QLCIRARDDDKVLALYSRHYNADTLPRFDNWGSAAFMATATDENDDTLLYFQNYMGQWGGLVDLDTELPEGTQKLHIDIYGDSDGSLTIAPVWKDASGDTPNKKLDVVKGEWNSYDLEISEFGYPENGNTVIQLALTESTLPSFLIDNIYFWSNSTLTAVDFNFDDAAAAVDVYSLQGVCLRRGVDRSEATAGLPAGIYIVGGRKVIVRR
ncbi:MAG: hypothetical protein K2G75_02315, partial [Muribaculaceae bacterium]|nr:hypothetical protein [Muribaculaceae bacterium]